MSSDTIPISPARFAEAIKDLTITSLHLKVLEIRNSIAHLEYSNEQLRPFAEGREAALGGNTSSSNDQSQSQPQPGEPDQDCIDAIKENEHVIERMQERIHLVRAEVESRGASWAEFESREERELRTTGGGSESSRSAAAANQTADGEGDGGSNGNVNVNGGGGSGAGLPESLSEAWRDGTIEMGVIRNGTLHMNEPPPPRDQTAAGSGGGGGSGSGGSLTDEQLRRAVEERMRMDEAEDDDQDEGLHL